MGCGDRPPRLADTAHCPPAADPCIRRACSRPQRVRQGPHGSHPQRHGRAGHAAGPAVARNHRPGASDTCAGQRDMSAVARDERPGARDGSPDALAASTGGRDGPTVADAEQAVARRCPRAAPSRAVLAQITHPAPARTSVVVPAGVRGMRGCLDAAGARERSTSPTQPPAPCAIAKPRPSAADHRSRRDSPAARTTHALFEPRLPQHHQQRHRQRRHRRDDHRRRHHPLPLPLAEAIPGPSVEPPAILIGPDKHPRARAPAEHPAFADAKLALRPGGRRKNRALVPKVLRQLALALQDDRDRGARAEMISQSVPRSRSLATNRSRPRSRDESRASTLARAVA